MATRFLYFSPFLKDFKNSRNAFMLQGALEIFFNVMLLIVITYNNYLIIF